MANSSRTQVKGSEIFKKMRIQAEKALEFLHEDSQAKKNRLLETTPFAKLFTVGKSAEMVGVSSKTLGRTVTELLNRGEIGPIEKYPGTNKTKGYQFEVIQKAREYHNTVPWRDPKTDPCAIVGVIHFKGGVAKTEVASNTSRSFALKGYRVLIVDLDHQGSSTGSFGYFPDYDFDREDTIIPYFKGEKDSLDYAVKKTQWPNIDLIPGCMALDNFNWELASEAQELNQNERRELFYELRNGLTSISDNYDIILLDTPPSSSVNAFAIMAAATGIIVPIPPAKHDLASTMQFLAIGEQLTSGLLDDKYYDFFRFLVTKFQKQGNWSNNNVEFLHIYNEFFAGVCYQKVMRHMAAITDAAADFTTVYETENPNPTLLKELDEVFEQIEIDIMSTWPSKREKLMAMGYGV